MQKKTQYPRTTCTCCGKLIESKPLDCTEPKHVATWKKRQAQRKEYHKKWYAKNREKKLAQNTVWDKAHADERKEYFRKSALDWYYENKERARAREKLYFKKNKRKINARRNRKMIERRKRDPLMSIRYNMRSRLSTFLRDALPDRQFSCTKLLFPYTQEELRAHLEAQFVPGMTWENYGKDSDCREVDHIVPCFEFDFSKEADIRECFDLKNLRPLWALENRSGAFNQKRKVK